VLTYVHQIVVDDAEPAPERAWRVLASVRRDRDPGLIVLPELWLHGGFGYAGWADGIGLDDPLLTELSAIAADRRCHVHVGSVVLRHRDGPPTNTTLVYGPDGSLVARYDKIHLFGFDKGEAVAFRPGTDVVALPIGPATVGLSICFDLRFPELYRRLSDLGAELLVVPAAWPDARAEHWRVLLRARAIESQSFVCAAATAGSHAGLTMSGYSAIISPTGEMIAEASADGDAVLVADLDLDVVHRVRTEFPVLAWRRLDVATEVD
jgi:predicted amidohydrolase